MVPNTSDDSDEYLSAEEKEVVKPEQRRRTLPLREVLPTLARSADIVMFFYLFEAVMREEEQSLDSLSSQMLLISRMTACPEVHAAAMSLVHPQWGDLKRALLSAFGNVARQRAELERRIRDIRFERDTIANQMRTLADWSEALDVPNFEIVARVFAVPVIPQRALEMMITRCERDHPGAHWHRLPLPVLCDVLDDVCVLLAEFEAVAPARSHAPRVDAVRRVQPPATSVRPGGRAGAGAAGSPTNWMDQWVSRFKQVLYVRQEVPDHQLAALQRAASEFRRINRRGEHASFYYLFGFAEVEKAAEALAELPAGLGRVFEPRPVRRDF